MTPVPFDLPVKPSEAVAVADLVFDHAGNRPLTDDLRNRLAGRAAALRLETVLPWFGSLERDPVHPDTYYLAVDAAGGAALLMHIALASAPSSGLFPKSLLIARMRSAADREVVVNAVPFGIGDRENIRRFAERVNPAFLPRPQGGQTSVVVCGGEPSIAMPAAFEAFRCVWKRSGRNLAAVAGECHAALWAAIRAGWREGFNLETEAAGVTADWAVYSRFRSHTPVASALEAWEAVRRAKAGSRSSRSFDFELTLPETVTPEQLAGILEQWKGTGRPLQAVGVTLASWEQAAALAAVARRHQVMLSVSTSPDVSAEAVEALARAALGRIQLRLQFDFADSRERILERTNAVARSLAG